jgi:hypothetical protein
MVPISQHIRDNQRLDIDRIASKINISHGKKRRKSDVRSIRSTSCYFVHRWTEFLVTLGRLTAQKLFKHFVPSWKRKQSVSILRTSCIVLYRVMSVFVVETSPWQNGEFLNRAAQTQKSFGEVPQRLFQDMVQWNLPKPDPLYTGNRDKRKINFGTELFPV